MEFIFLPTADVWWACRRRVEFPTRIRPVENALFLYGSIRTVIVVARNQLKASWYKAAHDRAPMTQFQIEDNLQGKMYDIYGDLSTKCLKELADVRRSTSTVHARVRRTNQRPRMGSNDPSKNTSRWQHPPSADLATRTMKQCVFPATHVPSKIPKCGIQIIFKTIHATTITQSRDKRSACRIPDQTSAREDRCLQLHRNWFLTGCSPKAARVPDTTSSPHNP